MATPFRYVEIVHVTSLQEQQEVIKVFRDIAGLTAWGISSAHGPSVVFGCANSLMKSAAEVLLAEIDPASVCTQISWPQLHDPMPASPGRRRLTRFPTSKKRPSKADSRA